MTSPHRPFLRRIDHSGISLLIMRLVLAGLFLYLGTKKIMDPIAFLKAIRLYKMLPEDPAIFLNASAIVLPWFEVLAGLALLFGVWIRGAGLLMALMLAIFTPAVFLRAWEIHTTQGIPFMEIKFDCGCGSGPVTIWKKLVENSSLFIMSVLVALSNTRRFCVERFFDRGSAQLYCTACGYLRKKRLNECCAETS